MLKILYIELDENTVAIDIKDIDEKNLSKNYFSQMLTTNSKKEFNKNVKQLASPQEIFCKLLNKDIPSFEKYNLCFEKYKTLVNDVLVYDSPETLKTTTYQKYIKYLDSIQSPLNLDFTYTTHSLTLSNKIETTDLEDIIINAKIHEFNSFEELFDFLLDFLIRHNLTINICKNCNKYFAPTGRCSELYCNNISPQDNQKSCKEYSRANAYKESLETDTIKALERKVYLSLSYQARKFKDDEEKLEAFKKENKKWKTQLKSNQEIKEEYSKWLQKIFDNKKVDSYNKNLNFLTNG